MTGVHAGNAAGLVSRSSRPGVTQTGKYGRGEGETVRRQGRISRHYQPAPSMR
ncbi:MAG: hypothetical protein H6668_23835 [Ardenticatenaceae bacterium]|nr:hypothetical protein [Ardenticatenaceae bacterium]